MPRKASRTTVSRGTSRKFVWVRRQLFQGPASNVETGTDLLSTFETAYGAQLIGCTIVRIRGLMFAFTDEAAGAVDSFRMAARVTSGNVDISTAVPDLTPFTDENADWMLYEPFINFTGNTDGHVGNIRYVDNQSSRKIEELGERFVMFHGSNPAAPTVQWGYGYDLSIGIKLP